MACTAIVGALRTLIISDLHLGLRSGHDVLRRPAPLDRLLSVLGDIERLVLLGDVVELAERRASAAMPAAEPVLRAIGERMRGGEVHLVPGNHDHALVRVWAQAQDGLLSPASVVPPSASPLLERLRGWLGPGRVRVSYPGLWLSDEVWVTHGHHLNRHLLPRNATGLRREWLGRPSAAREPGDYERTGPDSRGMAAVRGPLAVARRLVDPEISPLTAWVLGHQLRRAALPALRRVIDGFAVDARFVVFGHVHRLGPLPSDDASLWSAPPSDDASLWSAPGGPSLLNTGSWLYEPLLVRHATPPHPYWPGGAVLLEEGAEPQAIGLLDDLDAQALSGRG